MDDTPHLRPIKAHLQPLADSLKKSGLSTHLSTKTGVETALQRAQILLGCYRKDDAADPETYAGAVAAVLAEYTTDIVRRVTDPRTGLPSRMQWLPSVKEVRDACDELEQRERSIAAAAALQEKQLRERREWLASQQVRPTLDDLKAKHGENWGMTPAEQDAAAAARRRSTLAEANRRLFAEECAAAGMPEDSPVSPTLHALIKAGIA